MNSENAAIGKENPASDSAPGQGTTVSGELVPLTGSRELATGTDVSLFPIVRRAGKAAVFAADEFFFGTIRNAHTRPPVPRVG